MKTEIEIKIFVAGLLMRLQKLLKSFDKGKGDVLTGLVLRPFIAVKKNSSNLWENLFQNMPSR